MAAARLAVGKVAWCYNGGMFDAVEHLELTVVSTFVRTLIRRLHESAERRRARGGGSVAETVDAYGRRCLLGCLFVRCGVATVETKVHLSYIH